MSAVAAGQALLECGSVLPLSRRLADRRASWSPTSRRREIDPVKRRQAAGGDEPQPYCR